MLRTEATSRDAQRMKRLPNGCRLVGKKIGVSHITLFFKDSEGLYVLATYYPK